MTRLLQRAYPRTTCMSTTYTLNKTRKTAVDVESTSTSNGKAPRQADMSRTPTRKPHNGVYYSESATANHEPLWKHTVVVRKWPILPRHASRTSGEPAPRSKPPRAQPTTSTAQTMRTTSLTPGQSLAESTGRLAAVSPFFLFDERMFGHSRMQGWA